MSLLWDGGYSARSDEERVPLPIAGALTVLVLWGATLVGAFLIGMQFRLEEAIQYKQEAIVAQGYADSLAVRADRILRDAAYASAMTAEVQELLLDLLVYRDAMNAGAR